MDRNSLIGISLMMALLIGYFYFTSPSEAQLQEQKRVQDSIALVESQKQIIADTVADKITAVDSIKTEPATPVQAGNFGANVGAEKITQLKNDEYTIQFSSKGGRVASVQLNQYKRSDSSDLILFGQEQSKWDYEFITKDGIVVNTGSLNWKLEKTTANSISYILPYDSVSFVRQSYTLTKDSYLVNYNLAFINMNGKIAPNRSQIALHWDLDVPLQELDAKAERQKSTIYYKYTKDDPDYISETKFDSETLDGKTEWVSFKQQFFNTTLIARNKPFLPESKIETIESEQDSIVKYYKSSLDLDYQQLANEQYNMSFYFGPNHVPTLKKVGLQLDHIIPLGWVLFRAVNEYAIIPLFNFLRSFISNYGLVILLLTLIVKLVLLPLTYKSYKSTAKMKVLKPEIDKIKEKHKGDAQKAQVETMSLYRSFGVSPMGGCLPMVLQMPILLSIFFFFPSSIELRQESFLWAQDLSRYDSVLELGFSIPFYGSHVSLFTILMTIATFLYTYMNNQVSGATGQMKYIGYIMPIFFLGFFNNYASGLTYYYFLSNMITFTQQFTIRKFFVDDDKIRAQMETFKKSKGKNKKGPSNFQKKLEEMAKKRGIDPKTGKRK